MIDAPTPNKLVLDLDQYLVTKAQLCELTGINPKTFVNYLTLQNLNLFSPHVGRGKTRYFYLMDIYMVALLSRIVFLTQEAEWSVRAVETFVLFHMLKHHGHSEDILNTEWLKEYVRKEKADAEARSRGEKRDAKSRAAYDHDYQHGILGQHPMFYMRDIERPWFVFIDRADLNDIKTARLIVVQEIGEYVSEYVDCGYVINMTRVLIDLDAKINAMLESEGLKDIE